MDEEHVDGRRVQPPAIATAVSRGRARSDLGPESAHVMETRRGRVGRPHALSLLTSDDDRGGRDNSSQGPATSFASPDRAGGTEEALMTLPDDIRWRERRGG